MVVLASGPSLSIEDCEHVRAWRDLGGASRGVVAVNTTFQRAPWADVLYACDADWWHLWHARAERIAASQLWTCEKRAAHEFGLRLVTSVLGEAMGGRPGAARHGGNSGYQAVALALSLGAARVVLLGFDMKFAADGRKHWHPDHAGRNPAPRTFGAWIRAFGELAAASQVPIVNASADTALECFPRLPLMDALV